MKNKGDNMKITRKAMHKAISELRKILIADNIKDDEIVLEFPFPKSIPSDYYCGKYTKVDYIKNIDDAINFLIERLNFYDIFRIMGNNWKIYKGFHFGNGKIEDGYCNCKIKTTIKRNQFIEKQEMSL